MRSPDMANEASQAMPSDLTMQIHSEDGFGTYFFHELEFSAGQNETVLAFRCHTPNKYWEGQFGLATFLAAVRDQLPHHGMWKMTQIELADDWKGITLERAIAIGDSLVKSIDTAAADLKALLHSAEVTCRVLPGRTIMQKTRIFSVASSCYPLLRRTGFLFVRYTHGKRRNTGRISHSQRLRPLGIIGTMVSRRRPEM